MICTERFESGERGIVNGELEFPQFTSLSWIFAVKRVTKSRRSACHFTLWRNPLRDIGSGGGQR